MSRCKDEKIEDLKRERTYFSDLNNIKKLNDDLKDLKKSIFSLSSMSEKIAGALEKFISLFNKPDNQTPDNSEGMFL